MQEYGISVVDALKQGLPPDRRAEARGDFVSRLVNIRPTNFGAEGIKHLTVPAGLYDKVSWPFPQVFYGRRHTFICLKDKILRIVPGNEEQMTNVEELRTLKWDEDFTDLAIPAGGIWQMADMGDAYYLYNGECVVFSIFEGFGDNAFINTDVTINCGARFKGRVVFGGLDSDVFTHFNKLVSEVQDTDSALTTQYNDPTTRFFETRSTPFDIDVDEFHSNHVMWSSIGGGDFPAWLFWPKQFSNEYASGKEHEPTWKRIRRRFKRNQLGWMELPMRGEVKALEPLGDTAVIAYSDSNVVALLPTQERGRAERPATFGMRQLARVGIKSRGAVKDSPQGQAFVGDDGRLRLIGPDLEMNTLGYKQFLEDLDEVVVEYEPREEEFYISDGDRAFTLGSNGAFYEHERAVTSFVSLGGETRAAAVSTGEASGLLETSFQDFGQTGHKTITQVDVDYRGPHQPYVAIAYRYTAEQPLQTTPWKQCGPDGSVPLRVTAKEFKVRVYFPTYENLEIDDLQVRFQLPDKRFIRGTRADSANTGAG